MVNHIPVKIKEGRGVFEYAVMFNPVIDSRNVRFKLVAAQKEILGTTRIFDGSKLFLPLKFPDKVSALLS